MGFYHTCLYLTAIFVLIPIPQLEGVAPVEKISNHNGERKDPDIKREGRGNPVINCFGCNTYFGKWSRPEQGKDKDLISGQKCTSAIGGGILLDVLCTVAQYDPIYQVETLACDAHCRCTHNTSWGRCEPRPPTAPPFPELVNSGIKMWCKCYTDPSTRPCLPAINPVACIVQNAIANVLCAVPNDGLGLCNADCVCTHGNARGVCTKDSGVTMCACYD